MYTVRYTITHWLLTLLPMWWYAFQRRWLAIVARASRFCYRYRVVLAHSCCCSYFYFAALLPFLWLPSTYFVCRTRNGEKFISAHHLVLAATVSSARLRTPNALDGKVRQHVNKGRIEPAKRAWDLNANKCLCAHAATARLWEFSQFLSIYLLLFLLFWDFVFILICFIFFWYTEGSLSYLENLCAWVVAESVNRTIALSSCVAALRLGRVACCSIVLLAWQLFARIVAILLGIFFHFLNPIFYIFFYFIKFFSLLCSCTFRVARHWICCTCCWRVVQQLCASARALKPLA